MLDRLRHHERRCVVTARPAAGVHLHAMVISAGIERRERDYDWHGLRRGDAAFGLLQITLAGRGRLTYDGRDHDVDPGMAMLLAIPHDHRYALPPGGVWEHAYLCFNGAEALRLWRAVRAAYGPLTTLADDHPVLAAFEDLVLDALDADPSAWRLSSRLYDLLLRLAEPRSAAGDLPPGILAAQTLGRRRLAEAIGVDDLARAAGMSRWHFTRQFQRHCGCAPGAWLHAERLAAAARLLAAGDLPVGGIARRCGFGDPGYFARAFRRAYGTTPVVFRRSGMA